MTDSLTEPRPTRWAPRFFAIWIGQAFSLLGSMLVQFALVWWLTQTTGSATVLAMATLVAVLPRVVIGPFAGALVDRWNRRLVMIAADSADRADHPGADRTCTRPAGCRCGTSTSSMFLRSALGAFPLAGHAGLDLADGAQRSSWRASPG